MSTPFPTVFSALVHEPPAEHLLLIVVGASVRAEIRHRPLAYWLVEKIMEWIAEQDAADIRVPLNPLVITDVWYLNQDDLHGQPVIAIGDPEVNAATAYLASRLPAGYVVEGSLRVQLDPEFIDLRACMWGVEGDGQTSSTGTGMAVQAFTERYMGEFLQAAHDAL